ncbi:hypothetical protein AKAW_00471 [Aspergillus luchuensis IFO 4308]|nr:hypothetical protein AKAW_00471 [Aspergillus luchuensis IFO 4308]
MAADIVARKLLSQKQNSPRVNRLLCLSRSVPGDETHVEDLPGGGQSNLERYIAYGRETPARRLAGSLFYLVLLLLLITMAIIIVAHAVSIPVQDYFQCFFC